MTARMTSADVAVVGAGPSGCVMARRLAEAGADVLLLEAGGHAASPRAGLLDVGPDSLVVTRHRARLGDAQLDLPRGHALGGSGAVNGGYCVAARPADLATWGPGWQRRYEAGLARAAERLRPTLVPMSPVAARVAAAFPGRASAVPQARRGARRVTAFDAWDPPGAGARVRTGARVARLHWAGGEVGGRCDGVVLEPARPEPARPEPARPEPPRPEPPRPEEGSARIARESGAPNPLVDEARGDDEVITARHVILCAGTIGTTSILRNSGLGESTGHPVGHRVQEHPEVLLDLPVGFAAGTDFGVGDPAVLPPLLSHVVRLELADRAGPAGEAPEVELRPYSVPMHEVIPGAAPMPLRLGISLMNTVGFGRIDPDGTVVLPDDPRDAEALRAAAVAVADRLGLDTAVPVRSTSHHLSGAARIGEVVDDSGRVFGVDGLRVADASVLPTLPRCGPYYTVLAVAETLAADMAAERPW